MTDLIGGVPEVAVEQDLLGCVQCESEVVVDPGQTPGGREGGCWVCVAVTVASAVVVTASGREDQEISELVGECSGVGPADPVGDFRICAHQLGGGLKAAEQPVCLHRPVRCVVTVGCESQCGFVAGVERRASLLAGNS